MMRKAFSVGVGLATVALAADPASGNSEAAAVQHFGDQMRHFAADGKPKTDGESRRLHGNRLDEFR